MLTASPEEAIESEVSRVVTSAVFVGAPLLKIKFLCLDYITRNV
jgi:hypothetical protein